MNKRKNFLDGIRSISCFGVYAHHFMFAFLPAMYFGIGKHSSFEKIETDASQATWSIFINGNFMVALFILITAHIFTKKFLDISDQ